LRIVSSGASNIASSVRSAASAIVDKDSDSAIHDQVEWASFDKIEYENNVTCQILLLGYRTGFQVWDVEEADNVQELISRTDGPVSFMQVLPKPLAAKLSIDKFRESRPLLAICTDSTFSGDRNMKHENIEISHDHVNDGVLSNAVWFYSFISQSYVHTLKFRSLIYSVRCSTRVVAVLQSAQIHCFDAATLERDYTILTNPVVSSIGFGPLAVGPRWIAYSGPAAMSLNSGSANLNHVSNESLIAHAKESSKQLASGLITLGDKGYKKLSRYYSENLRQKDSVTINRHLLDEENVGMVIVRDVVGKCVIAQFRAHKSPISCLCFDPSGILLVTASIQGHNINVFRVTSGSYEQIYRLQRGFTNAVIQDVSFSYDSNWIMVSSSRGTNHLFAISPSGGPVHLECGSDMISKPAVYGSPNSVLQLPNDDMGNSSAPISLTAVSRIRSGQNGWRGTMTGAPAAATASTFQVYSGESLKSNYHILVFSPGCMIQYNLRMLSFGFDSVTTYELAEFDERFVVEAIQKWNISQKQNETEEEDIDIYGENRNAGGGKMFLDAGKLKSSPEERDHHVYIAEAELRIHKPNSDKPKIRFHLMLKDGTEINEEGGGLSGEIEIEKIPTRLLEAKPKAKALVPVLGHF
jgi:hypothetical protein